MPVPAIAASTARSVAPPALHEQRPGRIDPHHLAVALELPRRHRAAGEAAAQAGVAEQVARVARAGRGDRDRPARRRSRSAGRAARSAPRSCPAPAARRSGCRRRSRPPARRRSCPRRSPPAGCRDRRRGSGGTIAGSTSRAALTGTLSRSVPAGRSRKPFTTSSAASTSVNAGPSRSSRRCAGLGRRDAARRAVEQPDAELRFQPAHRLAEAGGAAAARARAVAKAAGARHRDEGVQITEIDLHCSLFRTACADCARLSRSARAIVLACAIGSEEIDHVQHRQSRHIHPRRPHREAARLRRHAARRARRVRAAEGSRRRARGAARGGRAAASTTSTPATSTARTSPIRSSARRCTPIPTISSSSPRSAPGAARMDRGSRPSRPRS